MANRCVDRMVINVQVGHAESCFYRQHMKSKNLIHLIMRHVFFNPDFAIKPSVGHAYMRLTSLSSPPPSQECFSFITYRYLENRRFFDPEHRFCPADPVSLSISFPPAIVFVVAPTHEPLCMCCNSYVTALRKKDLALSEAAIQSPISLLE